MTDEVAVAGIDKRLLEWTAPPPQETFQQRGLRVFEEAGLIRRDEQGVIITDLNNLAGNLDYNNLRFRLGQQEVTDRHGTYSRFLNKIPAFYEVFKNTHVYSEEDWARKQAGEDIAPKSLFYVPEDEKAVLSPKEIANADFYLGLWDLDTTLIPKTYPTKKDGLASPLSTHETIVTALIFHPKYGAGFRNEAGQLTVKYKDGSIRPISGDFFRSWGYRGGPGVREQDLFGRPGEWFSQRAPRLVAASLVDPVRDFRVMQGTKTEVNVGSNFRTPTYKGLVMVDQTRYTLGSEYEGKRGYRVLKMSEKYAAIVIKQPDGSMRLEAVFGLVPGMQTERLPSGKKRYGYLRKGEFELNKVGDLEEEVSEMALAARNFDTFLAFSKRITKEANVSLMGLTQGEQTRALSLYLQFGGRADFWEFVKKFKLDGIRTLFSVGTTYRGI